jgi:hypothetical protein
MFEMKHFPKFFICSRVYQPRWVDYFGCRDGKGIWGRWQLPRLPRTKGGFHIWPIDSGGDFESMEQGLPSSQSVLGASK